MGRPPGWAAAQRRSGRRCCRRDDRRYVRISNARSGRRSRVGLRAKTQRSHAACRVPWDPAGSDTLAECRRSSWLRRRGDICPSPNERTSPSCGRRESPCNRSPSGFEKSASTISRELRRNAATRNGKLEYRASTAQWKADLAVRLLPVRIARHQRTQPAMNWSYADASSGDSTVTLHCRCVSPIGARIPRSS